MRALAALTAAAFVAGAASAASAAAVPEISISIGADLQKKADESYGPREMDVLKKDLSQALARSFARASAQPLQRVDLTIDDAVPNRPTFKQLGRAGLSLGSIGLGGAAVSGTVTTADGQIVPVSYNWYETSLWNEVGAITWSDAWRAFNRFSGDLARGERPHQRKVTPDRYAGDFGRWMR
jgi:hypothetical protein